MSIFDSIDQNKSQQNEVSTYEEILPSKALLKNDD